MKEEMSCLNHKPPLQLGEQELELFSSISDHRNKIFVPSKRNKTSEATTVQHMRGVQTGVRPLSKRISLLSDGGGHTGLGRRGCGWSLACPRPIGRSLFSSPLL